MCALKTEQEQEAEENSRIYGDLQAARETIEELKREKGFICVSTFSYDIRQISWYLKDIYCNDMRNGNR